VNADVVRLADDATGTDLQTFLQRAKRLGCEHVRLHAFASTLVVTVAVLTKQSLLGTDPTVLGLRTFALDEESAVDATASVAAVLDRLARERTRFAIPVGQPGVAWAGVAVPQGGWRQVGAISEDALERVARAGIDTVANANGLGVKIVDQVRRDTWGASIPSSSDGRTIPAGVAFAAFGLGFLGVVDGVASVSESGVWTRVSTNRGHIVTR
jgi:hypothetical protein